MGQLPENTAALEPSPSPASLRVDSPMTYLFVGIGTMLALVILALLMVACSQWSRRSPPDDDHHSHKVVRQVYHAGDEANVTPEIVVFMPGDQLPTYLAAPAHDDIMVADTTDHQTWSKTGLDDDIPMGDAMLESYGYTTMDPRKETIEKAHTAVIQFDISDFCLEHIGAHIDK
ncbi:hypothetical protein L6452_10725 [Arctium lappa]|uniref:Uncharacterized protein n=1 Tax=Arctium lappa TaxID=4217 RepID=A0ACB9DN98_ARCLA|nr:hypothetical protein L6452_10725 [Arctium lappa]